MITRLTAQDASFYFLEGGSTPMHGGSLAVFSRPRGGFEYETLLRVVEQRLCLVPRYRQKVREVVLGLARPVWVDDPDFDIEYHVRRSALPRPGTDEQLFDLVARLTSRPLDTTRPLWEMYLVEGLSRNRFAIFTKSHSALVDGIDHRDIGHVVLDDAKAVPEQGEELWMPGPEPSATTLLAGAVGELIARPAEGLGLVRKGFGDVASTVGGAVEAVENTAAVLRIATSRAPSNPLNRPISRNRRFATARTDLEAYRAIRRRYGGEINDVILAVVAGALRNWLLSRGELVGEAARVRAMVPISVYDQDDSSSAYDPSEDGSGYAEPSRKVSSFLIDLPVGEANPVVRLSHVQHASAEFAKQSRQVTAATMVRLSGFAPATLHAVGARAASTWSRRMFNLMVTNAPGPQAPRYLGGARMLEMYPVAPLLENQSLGIALTSYDGHVYYGLNADRDAMADVAVVASLLRESLDELADAAG
ncbi:wax ester/triacylglycerol synthase family O-acyltransferase [Rhodococcus sp. HNM0569]|uniref:WS/DGAT/MGAT family O-acyltransferase n=1 Tax=Rhodococcus sp. HNM0569 TaxID=2716340 RepID=UPI00146B8998|nr:wax ester/triacylglycerol synthase family O-acyltransferase [Rhodococcus sp. HNM0569]NLU81924.1 wax ester/triacylglycerol synthase family O-acyltransferase [Rhodococcus sp. HNM0569]